MPQSDLRQTVRERLASGWLFPAPSQTWDGKGTGHVCIVCGITIQSSEVENEVVGPMTVWSHCRAIRSGAKNHRPTNWQRVRMGPTEGTEATTLPVSVRTVRERFANRRLFVLPHDKSWTGRGKSDLCAVCSKPLFAAELSQEVIGAPQARAHLVCYRAWLLESIAVRQSDGRSSAESADTAAS